MTAPTAQTAKATHSDHAHAEFIDFEEFRDGLPRGQFRVIVNPDLARPFVMQRTHATGLAITLIGPGIVCALSGYVVIGGVLVASGIVLRRLVRHQAAKILLHLALRQPGTYFEATTGGVMEVQRVGSGT
jgi:hypothetical protein